MENFVELESLDNFEKLIKEGITLVYLSRPSCGVCSAIKGKISHLFIEDFPQIKSFYINMDKIPDSAGYFSVFTIPAIIVYIDGKESIREARYISIEKFAGDLQRLYDLYLG
ncbi:MAG: thioredoxin family protein [Spirochaetales bacterium]|nr:thioredoxin family protein [Spirochaetales bacterium]